ncbi:prolipoprotein diacylglyceryl transferase [Luteimonas aquatica]|uniref:prolipoprotein diacylglyceryl transferase n=1 Tax=Luteimonas aquatica TaxID=450364 RepID=UPI001F55AA85|nr:prolipoprotein diacylglyceryl transferase family protein [Luteimonas aquatica]
MPPSPYWIHTLFEVAAYAIGFRLYLRERQRQALPALASREHAIAVAAGAIIGAALGSKLAYWLYDPLYAFAGFPDPRRLLEGKSIIGALLGGLAGVEIAKRLEGVRGSTGDAFVLPLIAGMCIGRIGCFLAGLNDHTYGNPTALPWGVDFGDGVPRHPTQLYEIAFLLALGAWIARHGGRFAREGDRFRAFMVAYLGYRLLIEWIRPIPLHYLGLFSGLQLLCLAGLLYYLRDIPRIAGTLAWRR